MIHSGFAHDALNFGVVIRWRLIIQIHPNQAHPIICWRLCWLINNHQLESQFAGRFFWLYRGLKQSFNNNIWWGWRPRGSNPGQMINVVVVQIWDISYCKPIKKILYSARYPAIMSLLQSYSFYTCLTTSCESPLMRSHRILRSLAS
jgi:hypothetical protein